jgi:hypothetical protein
MWTKSYSEAAKECAEPKEVRRLEGIYTHEMQPYGWVKLKDCVVWEREVPTFDFRQQAYTGKHKQLSITGTVTESKYCGALYFGVPVRTPDDRNYPPGSTHDFDVKHESDLERMCTVTTPNL